jgi:hypothetical protein
VVVDHVLSLFARRDILIVPSLNDPLPLQPFQVFGQFVTFKAKIALEAAKGLKTINEIASEAEVHSTQVTI